MPKVVDVEERQREIAAALLRVAMRDGLAATSVRTVGTEAGISPGALRHYFANQDELVVFALSTLEQVIREEIAGLRDVRDPVDAATEVLARLLPVDDGARAACRLWFEVTTLAPHRPALESVWRQTYAATLEACTTVVRLAAPGLTGTDLDREARRLHRFVDGLALHGTYDEAVTASAMLSDVRAELERLAGS